LIQYLKENGDKPVYLWSRGGYTGPFNFLKKGLRKVLGKKIVPSGRTEQRAKAFSKPGVSKLWLKLAILDLILVYAIYIRYLKLTGKTIVADRYLHDTWIDFKLNFPQIKFDKWLIWKFLNLVLPKPNHTFLLLIPADESMRRGKLKNEPFPDSRETLEKRLKNYEQFAREHSWQVINCLKSIEKINNLIIKNIL